MPPRKSTSSVTPADPDDSLLQHSSPVAHTDKPVFATEQQLKARAEAGASVEVRQHEHALRIKGCHHTHGLFIYAWAGEEPDQANAISGNP